MPTINFDMRSDFGQPVDPDLIVSGVDIVNIPGMNQFDRLIIITPAMVPNVGVPAGSYEHVTESGNGDWTYAPCRR